MFWRPGRAPRWVALVLLLILVLRRDLDAERRLVADLIGQLREPDGT